MGFTVDLFNLVLNFRDKWSIRNVEADYRKEGSTTNFAGNYEF